MFLFSHFTYVVQLLYLGKLSRPKYQQKLNKIMKISQEDVILIKNLYLSKQCGTGRLLSELPDKGWKLGSIDSLLNKSHKTGTIVHQPGSGRPRLSRSSEGPCAQSLPHTQCTGRDISSPQLTTFGYSGQDPKQQTCKYIHLYSPYTDGIKILRNKLN